HAGVAVVLGERIAAGQALGVRRAELVVGEDQVRTAALDVEAQPQAVQRDHGTFQVPPRTTGAQLGVPGRFSRAGRSPQQRVQRVFLAGAVGIPAALGE